MAQPATWAEQPQPSGGGRDNALVRLARAASGALTAGMVVLTLAVLGVAYLATQRTIDGPGAASIAVHVVASLACLAAQRFADRRRGVAVLLGSGAVLVIVVLVLMTQWWS
jgi:hypothetical protein